MRRSNDLPVLSRLFSPLIYASVASHAVLEAQTYSDAAGIEYDWGHVRWERSQRRRSVVGIATDRYVDWCFVILSLQQATVNDPHARSQAQRMLENFVRARLGRNPLAKVDVPGPITMLRLSARADKSAAAWASLGNVLRLIPLWTSSIEQCLPGAVHAKQPASDVDRHSTYGELLRGAE
jgi:hypothetical protein